MLVCKQTKTLKEAKALIVDNFEVVNVLSWHAKETKYSELCPYVLKTDGNGPFNVPAGIIFENFYQNTKVYPRVYDITVKPNHMSKIVWWKFTCPGGSEEHVVDGKITPSYYKWRDSIWACPNPIRYPNGRHRRHTVLFSMIEENGVEIRYNYIEARINIYVSEYMRLIRQLPIYHTLLGKLRRGENLCITEVDLPSAEKSGLYSNVDDDGFFIPTLENLTEMIHDPSSPFGHGLCLAAALLEDL